MGMYDRVEFDDSIDLPGFEGGEPRHGWQTKEFNRVLGIYRISEDGRLLKEEYHTEEVPEEERPHYNEEIEGFEDNLDEMFGSFQRITDDWNEVDFHGEMRVVGVTEELFYEYNLKFTDGVLEDIELLEKHERNDL